MQKVKQGIFAARRLSSSSIIFRLKAYLVSQVNEIQAQIQSLSFDNFHLTNKFILSLDKSYTESEVQNILIKSTEYSGLKSNAIKFVNFKNGSSIIEFVIVGITGLFAGLPTLLASVSYSVKQLNIVIKDIDKVIKNSDKAIDSFYQLKNKIDANQLESFNKDGVLAILQNSYNKKQIIEIEEFVSNVGYELVKIDSKGELKILVKQKT